MRRHHLELLMWPFMDGLTKTSTEAPEGYMYQCTTEAQIISGSLPVRSQHCYAIPPTSATEFPKDKMANVCAHLVHDPSRPTFSPDRLGALLSRYFPNSNTCRLAECTGIKKCFHYNTEIQTHTKAYPNQGTAIGIFQ